MTQILIKLKKDQHMNYQAMPKNPFHSILQVIPTSMMDHRSLVLLFASILMNVMKATFVQQHQRALKNAPIVTEVLRAAVVEDI